MNQRPPTTDCRHPAQGADHTTHHAWLRSMAMVLACALSASAQAPSASGIERLLAQDAAFQLDSPDAEIRGEAALIVASAGLVEQEARLLELAEDPAPEARHRAILALGLLATPAAVTVLENQLRSLEARSTNDGVIAAYALGIVPSDRVGTSVARTLPLFERGSWKRQHDVLIALLLGMTTHDERPEREALTRLFENDANRSPTARALLLQLLLNIDGTLDERELHRTLRRGSDEERLAIVNWLATRPPESHAPWLKELTRIAERDKSPALRTSALRALTHCRHLPALELAARALRSSSPQECSTALTAMLAIGGAKTRGALEQHLLAERNPVRMAALMCSFLAPPSKRLLDHAMHVATDRSQQLATRAAAAEMIARTDKLRAAPVLRDLFRIANDPAILTKLARVLHRVEATPTSLNRLLNRPVSLSKHAQRWQALLAAGHGEAQREVLSVLKAHRSKSGKTPTRRTPTSRDPGLEDLRVAVKSWRKAMVLSTISPRAPDVLAKCLQ